MEYITNSVVLPVTETQLNEFSDWVRVMYRTYDGYINAINSEQVDNYIKSFILPENMNYALRISDRHVGEKWGDARIKKMLLDRRRVKGKMKNLKEKIAKKTFPVQAAQARSAKAAVAESRKRAREAEELARVALWARFDAQEAKTKLTKTRYLEKDCDMADDCAICLSKHKMTASCVVGCGHQFGLVCLSNWKKETCPLCRTKIVETTGFVEMEIVNLII